MKCRVCRGRRSSTSGGTTPTSARRTSCTTAEEQVAKAIDDFEMIAPGRPGARRGVGRQGLARAVGPAARRSATRPTASTSGSASASYCDESGELRAGVRQGARAATLLEVDLPDDYGYDIPTGAKAARRVPCSACGLSKRHLFDEAALDGGYDVVAPATTSTTRPPCCSATCCAGTPTTSAASYPVLPGARRASRGR